MKQKFLNALKAKLKEQDIATDKYEYRTAIFDCIEIAEKIIEEPKSGMYSEMPKIIVGKFSIAMSSNKKDEEKIWIQDNTPKNEDGGDFNAKDLEPIIEDFYNKNF